MKNNKEKVEKLFNLLKDGMDMFTNERVHRGISLTISNMGETNFAIKEKNDERKDEIHVVGTPNEVVDKTLRTFYSLGRDGKNLEKLEFGEEFKEYKEAGKELWGYSALDQQHLIGKATPLEAIKDINFETGLEKFELKIDSLRAKDYDSSRWSVFAKDGNKVLIENDINNIGMDNIVKLFTDKESALEVIQEFGTEIKPIENIEVTRNIEEDNGVISLKKTEFSVDGKRYELEYMNYIPKVDDDDKMFDISLDELVDDKFRRAIYRQLVNNAADQIDMIEQKDFTWFDSDFLSKELWNSLRNNEELSVFLQEKDYSDLINHTEYSKAIPILPYSDKNIIDENIIANNIYHFKKDFENLDTVLPQILVSKDYQDDDKERNKHSISVFKENGLICLLEETNYKDGSIEFNLATENEDLETCDYADPLRNVFLKFKVEEGNKIVDIQSFENIKKVTEDTIDILNAFNKEECKHLPELLEVGKENAEYVYAESYFNNLKRDILYISKGKNDYFMPVERMEENINNYFQRNKTPLMEINIEKVEKIQDFFKEKIEEQKTINEEGYKGYKTSEFEFNFTIDDVEGFKYRTIEYENDKIKYIPLEKETVKKEKMNDDKEYSFE